MTRVIINSKKYTRRALGDYYNRGLPYDFTALHYRPGSVSHYGGRTA
jgi:hypothetical protein